MEFSLIFQILEDRIRHFRKEHTDVEIEVLVYGQGHFSMVHKGMLQI